MSLSRLEWVVYKIESEIAISSSSERAQVVGQLRSVELDQPFRTQNNPDHSIRPVVSISNLDRSRQTYHATQIHWNIRLQAHPDRCQPGRPRSRPRLVEERRRRGHRAPSWTADLPPTSRPNEHERDCSSAWSDYLDLQPRMADEGRETTSSGPDRFFTAGQSHYPVIYSIH
jgi:hypothetical protein